MKLLFAKKKLKIERQKECMDMKYGVILNDFLLFYMYVM